MLFVNKDSFISLSQFVYYSFSCLFVLARTSSTMFKSYGEKELPCLDPNLSGKLEFLTVKYDVS